MLKRMVDLSISLIMLLLLSPLLVVIAAIIVISEGSPVLFKQKRLGQGCEEITIHKFRTMKVQKLDNHESDENRITTLGKILRKFSLDELPMLYDVLIGNMSLVGPRPLLVKYKTRFNATQNRRHEVRPGITGLAQIKGRNRLSWDKKFQYDVFYVDNQSLLLDLKILAITLFQVITAKNVTPKGQEFMPEFMGSESRNGSTAED